MLIKLIEIKIMKNIKYIVASFLLTSSAFADEAVKILVPAILPSDTPIAAAVKKECAVPEKIGESIYLAVKQSFKNAEKVYSAESTDGYLVKSTLLNVYGAGGGGWSGSKAVSMRIEILKGGAVVKSTVLQRGSTGGVFGGLSGTCKIMERIEKALGNDSVKWLKENIQ